MTWTNFKFFTRSVESREPQILVENLKHYFGGKGLPKRFAVDDDESFSFNDENLKRFVQFWWDGRVGWNGATEKVIGSMGLGNWGVHTTISHSFQRMPALENKYPEFLMATSAALHVDFAYVHLESDRSAEIPPKDQRLPGAVGLDLDRALPGVPWAACYGKPYVELFGESKLLALPVKEVRKLNDEMIYCQLTEHISDVIEKPSEMAAAQEVVFKHLGHNAFYNPDDPDRLEFYNIDRSSDKIFAPTWPDPLTIPAVASKNWSPHKY